MFYKFYLQSIILLSLGQDYFSPIQILMMHLLQFNISINLAEMYRTIMQVSC